MDEFESITNDEKFSLFTLKVANHPKALAHWENLLNYLITRASPLNKSMDPSLYKLIKGTYDSMLFHFPFLENYYVDYALFEYKLGNIGNVHKIYQQGLHMFNDRSLILWISYLKICNEMMINKRELLKKYEAAEKKIGLHFFSGEFWELYLEQVQERCLTKTRYFIILRKVLEIPLHSFSKFFALWLRCIDDIQDISQLSRLAPKEELLKKLKLDVSFEGRRGPYLIEAKKLMKKFTKELYMVVQYQVLEIFALFESKLTTHFYCSPDTLISAEEIATWDSYLDYTVKQRIDSLTELNFQRALLPLAHYDIIWIKYSRWIIDYKDDLVTAKNILLRGLSVSHKKTGILKLLYSVLCKLKDYDLLGSILNRKESFYASTIDKADDFESFLDFVQFQTFCCNSIKMQTRYEKTDSDSLLPQNVFDIIMRRLSYGGSKKGQELLLSYLLQLQSKTNTTMIEEKVFKHIIEADWKFYLEDGKFWFLYSKLVFFDPSRSYLEKRRYIVNNVWKKAKSYKGDILPSLLRFCQSYSPEDIDTLQDIFESR